MLKKFKRNFEETRKTDNQNFPSTLINLYNIRFSANYNISKIIYRLISEALDWNFIFTPCEQVYNMKHFYTSKSLPLTRESKTLIKSAFQQCFVGVLHVGYTQTKAFTSQQRTVFKLVKTFKNIRMSVDELAVVTDSQRYLSIHNRIRNYYKILNSGNERLCLRVF